MAALNHCKFCGMSYCDTPDDVKKHQKIHERKVLAERKFGHIATYSERERLKTESYDSNGNDIKSGFDNRVYAYWSRSVEGCNYDLMHPDFREYKAFYLSNMPFMNGSYINMKRYKGFLNNTQQLNRTFDEFVCIKSGLVVARHCEVSDHPKVEFKVNEGDIFPVLGGNNGVEIGVHISDEWNGVGVVTLMSFYDEENKSMFHIDYHSGVCTTENEYAVFRRIYD